MVHALYIFSHQTQLKYCIYSFGGSKEENNQVQILQMFFEMAAFTLEKPYFRRKNKVF
jgi:hypothetical protein